MRAPAAIRMVFFALAVTSVPAFAVTAISSCADATISASGNYVVNADLACGIAINNSNVSVKLNGHLITGPGSGVGISTFGGDHIAIEGPGLIQNFDAGVQFLNCNYCQVALVTLAHNKNGLTLQFASFATIGSNVIVANGTGLGLTFVAKSTLQYNDVTGNSNSGISLRGTSEITVNNNVVSGNMIDGIAVTFISGLGNSFLRAYSNTANGNGEAGIDIVSGGGQPDQGNQFFNNTAKGNGTFDLLDQNPSCGTDIWSTDVFFVRNQACVR
jgi:parallel beta-helix repeat protein